MASLIPRQNIHAERVAKLILFAQSIGYAVSGGDWHRDSRCNYGSANSKHRVRLATDLNLFKIDRHGNYEDIRNDEGHKELGAYWKRMGGTWGGDFSNKEFNHYQTDQ